MGIVNGMGFCFLRMKEHFGKMRNLEYIVIYYGCAVYGSAASRCLKKLDDSVSGYEIMHRCIYNNPNSSTTSGNGRKAMGRHS